MVSLGMEFANCGAATEMIVCYITIHCNSGSGTVKTTTLVVGRILEKAVLQISHKT